MCEEQIELFAFAIRGSGDIVVLIMVSTALAGRYVGLEPVDDGVWVVHYRHVPLGLLSERTKRVYELGEYQV